jgi:hypothetical protein
MIASTSATAQTSACTTSNGNNAQCNVTPQLNFTLVVPRVVQLTLSVSSLILINNNAVAEDYEAGFKAAGSLTATVWADTGAVVTMAAATTNFTAPAGVTKAASTLQASVNGGAFTGLTTGGVPIISVGAGGSGGSGGSSGTSTNPVSISFRTLLGYTTDPPGSYSLTIKFTVTAP